jgi:hypothetical protein
MYRHKGLPTGIIAMPQEVMRALGSDHFGASPLQRGDYCASGERRQCSHKSAAATNTS